MLEILIMSLKRFV